MTKDDFQKSTGKADKAADAPPQKQTPAIGVFKPHSPTPLPPAPRAPFGMHLMPVATRIKILPPAVQTVKNEKAPPFKGTKDEE